MSKPKLYVSENVIEEFYSALANEDELELEENEQPEEEEVHSEYQKSDIGKSGKHIQTCTL